ncbi:MAG: hypothetical protein ABI416_02585 [Ginsengibacter sp.]
MANPVKCLRTEEDGKLNQKEFKILPVILHNSILRCVKVLEGVSMFDKPG